MSINSTFPAQNISRVNSFSTLGAIKSMSLRVIDVQTKVTKRFCHSPPTCATIITGQIQNILSGAHHPLFRSLQYSITLSLSENGGVAFGQRNQCRSLW